MTELEVIGTIIGALSKLESVEAKSRVLSYILSHEGVSASPSQPAQAAHLGGGPVTSAFATLADLFEAAEGQTEGDRVLTVAYWFQVLSDQPDWESQTINTELKHLGYAASNITRVIDRLVDARPAQVIQTRKSGTAKQARKKFKLTREGIKAVEAMLARREGGQ